MGLREHQGHQRVRQRHDHYDHVFDEKWVEKGQGTTPAGRGTRSVAPVTFSRARNSENLLHEIMAELLTYREAAELFDVSIRKIKGMVADGCPVSEQKRQKQPAPGRPVRLLDKDEVISWALAHGVKLNGLEDAVLKATDHEPPKRPTQRILDPPEQLEVVRAQYSNLLNLYVQATQGGDTTKNIGTLSRLLTGKGTELRLLEMSVLEWQTKTEALCNRAEMQRLFVELASSTKERIMAVPNELAPILREYLRDPDDVGKVRDEINAAIRHALLSLPDELPEKPR